MKKPKQRNHSNTNFRNENTTGQPQAAVEGQRGYGDKKLDGPNRPST
ncbi:MAG TPA: hypothetical protein VJ824_11890 [Bacillota bacterium]|nr:hypothetical protein [Bacillota bacterium]